MLLLFLNSDNEEAAITAIPKDKAEDLVEVIRNGMDRQREVYQQQQPHPHAGVDAATDSNNITTRSIADERIEKEK